MEIVLDRAGLLLEADAAAALLEEVDKEDDEDDPMDVLEILAASEVTYEDEAAGCNLLFVAVGEMLTSPSRIAVLVSKLPLLASNAA